MNQSFLGNNMLLRGRNNMGNTVTNNHSAPIPAFRPNAVQSQQPRQQAPVGQAPSQTQAPTNSGTPPVSLAGFGMYSDGNSFQADDADAENFLGRVQTYDPNAAIRYNDTNGEYNLSYDATKLPRNIYGGQGFGNLQDLTPGWWRGQLYQGQNQGVDPIYGTVTHHYNVDTTSDNSALARFGPALPLLFAGGIGALTGGFGLGAASTATGLANLPSAIGAASQGNYGGVLGAGLNMAGVPGGTFLGNAAGTMMQRSPQRG